MCCFLYIFYNKILVFNIFIVDTIGSLDDLIENYENQINNLSTLGLQIYEQKIKYKHKEIKVSSLNIRYGVSIPAQKRIYGKYKLFASNGISDYIDKFNAESAIIFGCRGSVGNTYYSKDKCFVLNTAFYIENKTEYGNLYFALKYEKGLSLYATGAAQPQITINDVSKAIIKFPIDDELNTILDLIVELQNKIEMLKKEKELLLKKYFG